MQTERSGQSKNQKDSLIQTPHSVFNYCRHGFSVADV